MAPELMAHQAKGIIMREVPRLRLNCSCQFGTAFLLAPILLFKGIIYPSYHPVKFRCSTVQLEDATADRL
jgi:hypothetical protein